MKPRTVNSDLQASFKIILSPRKIVISLGSIVLFLTFASIAVQLGKYVFDYREDWTRIFNMDRELNIPTCYSFLTLGLCGILLQIIANEKQAHQDAFSRYWKNLSIIFFVLALDEILSIHEILIIRDISRELNLPGFLRPVWVIPATILVICVGLKYLKFLAYLPKPTRFHFTLAGIVYIGGALGMEMVGGAYEAVANRASLTYGLMATFEEMLEMLGIIIFIYGLLFYLKQLGQKVQIQIQFSQET